MDYQLRFKTLQLYPHVQHKTNLALNLNKQKKPPKTKPKTKQSKHIATNLCKMTTVAFWTFVEEVRHLSQI